jgi:hypothetical protein
MIPGGATEAKALKPTLAIATSAVAVATKISRLRTTWPSRDSLIVCG